ncbi:Hsp20/alpha crystallin family protein [Oscillatoria sp. FACHB-1407]|uniref:Hsp20/alpha crystallin family protein n=1 Tax=Oscillatoria sp. FACHB-1407 TaxID=2692847 RepID=UPI001681F5AF|nr:Hsp20/alpha crystallin family protein [Oscillatoria sp. FACHB-1407]MBD2464759.1 Hsp20/alpha crystallin family protein [Oscillatoria sp. FACHB-1407]
MALLQRSSLENLSHWEPFREIESLQREMNRLFDRLLPDGNGEGRSPAFIPAAEIEEANDAIHLKLEAPGMEAKDLEVEVTETLVSIKGERKSESKTEGKGVMRTEFHYGKFERRISLPAHVQPDKVQAEFKNGMLSLTLPKAESEQRKTVKVKLD